MSLQAMTWVISHSPLKGADYTLHLLVADSVSDEHDMGFWMSPAKLAVKARCSRSTAVNFLWNVAVGAGLLEVVEDNRRRHDPSTGHRMASRFRFLLPDTPRVFDARRPGGEPMTGERSREDDGHDRRAREATTGERARPRPESGHISQGDIYPNGQSQGERVGADAPPVASDGDDNTLTSRERRWIDAREVVKHLNARLVEHGHAKEQRTTRAAVTDADLLLRLGASTWAKPEPIPIGEVLATIDAMHQLPRWSSGSSRAQVTRSPDALRRNWERITDEIRTSRKRPPSSGPLRGQRADRHADFDVYDDDQLRDAIRRGGIERADHRWMIAAVDEATRRGLNVTAEEAGVNPLILQGIAEINQRKAGHDTGRSSTADRPGQLALEAATDLP